MTAKFKIIAFFMLTILFTFHLVLYAADKVSGTLTVDSKTTKLSHIYALYEENAFDETKQDLVVWFSDNPLSAEALESGVEQSELASAGKIHAIRFAFDDQKNWISTKVLHEAFDNAGFMVSGTGPVPGELNVDAKSVSGKLEKTDETFGHNWSVKADFNATLPAKKTQQAAATGTPLPADGGAPGKVYMEYLKAMEKADIPALKKLLVMANAKELDRPETKEMLTMMAALRATDIKITGGTSDGKTATLQATGKDPSGAVSKGTIQMVMEDGVWKVSKDSWKTEFK